MSTEPTETSTPLHASGSSDRVLVRVPIGGDAWFQMPNRHDASWIASGMMLPWHEACWVPYMTTVRDMMLHGF